MDKRSLDSADKAELLDVDIRFLLANERTLLAWLRTALGLIAGGIALLHFNNGTDSLALAGLAVVFLGAVTSVIGYQRFRSADAAIRRQKLPVAGHGPKVQVVTVAVFALALVVLELLARR